MDMSDFTTWNIINATMLPFKRPCKSTCQAVSDVCGMTPSYLGFNNSDCHEVNTLTGLQTYSSDSTECTTTLTNYPVLVADAAEPYIAGKGKYCEGAVDEF